MAESIGDKTASTKPRIEAPHATRSEYLPTRAYYNKKPSTGSNLHASTSKRYERSQVQLIDYDPQLHS